MASSGNGQWRNRIVSSGVAEPDQLLANPSNWRIHPRNQQDALTGVLDEVGYVQDVIVNLRTSEDWPAGERGIETLVDGHLRIMLAMRHNEQQIPVKYVDLSPHEEALILATLDPISALAAPDAAKLDAVLREVQTGSEHVQNLLNDLAHDAGLNYGGAGDADAEPQIDRAEELNQKWQVKAGDLWRIGEHRLLCGDSIKREDVDRVMEGEKADMVWTDPPYGVDYEGGRNPDSNTPREKLQGDDSGDLYMPALKMYKSICINSAPMYIWFASSVGKPVYDAVAAIGYEIRALIVWNKIDAHYGSFMAQYMQKHEPCLYIVNGNPKWIGPTNEVTVWDVKQPNINEFHPTEKPMELALRPIGNHDAATIADFFAGSGPALVASQNLNRKCIAMEKKPQFCAVILERMATAFPGIEIERISSV